MDMPFNRSKVMTKALHLCYQAGNVEGAVENHLTGLQGNASFPLVIYSKSYCRTRVHWETLLVQICSMKHIAFVTCSLNLFTIKIMVKKIRDKRHLPVNILITVLKLLDTRWSSKKNIFNNLIFSIYFRYRQLEKEESQIFIRAI